MCTSYLGNTRGGWGSNDSQITGLLEEALPTCMYLPLVGKRQIIPGPLEPWFAMQQECLLGEPHCSLSQQV